jgi:hypothetical protein
VFYFSAMMAVDAEALATDSSLSTHPASVSACMARLQAWESRPQTRETRSQTREARYEAAAWTVATTPVLPTVPAWSSSPLLVELAWSGELLNHAPAWGGNWLYRARGGRRISKLHSSYPSGLVGHPAGLDAG